MAMHRFALSGRRLAHRQVVGLTAQVGWRPDRRHPRS